MEDNHLTANSFINNKVTLNGDLHTELGGRFNF
jgi:hypothetical protein